MHTIKKLPNNFPRKTPNLSPSLECLENTEQQQLILTYSEVTMDFTSHHQALQLLSAPLRHRPNSATIGDYIHKLTGRPTDFSFIAGFSRFFFLNRTDLFWTEYSNILYHLKMIILLSVVNTSRSFAVSEWGLTQMNLPTEWIPKWRS